MQQKVAEEIVRRVLEQVMINPAVTQKIKDVVFAENTGQGIIKPQTIIKIGDNLTIGVTMFCTILLTFIMCMVASFFIMEDWRLKGLHKIKAETEQKLALVQDSLDTHRSQLDYLYKQRNYGNFQTK